MFGNTHYFTKADAAEMFARRNGTWQDQSRTITELIRPINLGLAVQRKQPQKLLRVRFWLVDTRSSCRNLSLRIKPTRIWIKIY